MNKVFELFYHLGPADGLVEEKHLAEVIKVYGKGHVYCVRDESDCQSLADGRSRINLHYQGIKTIAEFKKLAERVKNLICLWS